MSELLTGIIFVITTRRVYQISFPLYEFTYIWPTLLRFLFINRLLTLLIIYDLKTYELHLPVRISLTAFILMSQFGGRTGDYPLAFICSIAFGGFFRLIYQGAKKRMLLRYKTPGEGIGEGDTMVAFLIGALFPYVFTTHQLAIEPFTVITMAISWLCVSSLSALLFARIQKITTQNKNLPQTIPFIPRMIVGYWIILRNTKIILTFWGL